MGYERHNAIIVSGSYKYGEVHWADKAHDEAERIFSQTEGVHGLWDIVSPVMASPVNSVRSFFIAPDGSKEGWDTSDIGDTRRQEFTAWLKAQAYEDGSTPLAWAEVQYGDDEMETKIVDDSDAIQRQPCPNACGHPYGWHGSDGCGGAGCTCTFIR